MSALPAYAELHCFSNFSFLRGASHAEELVARALRLGYTALVLLGRRRAEKGAYRLARNDLAGWDGGGVPDCLALWVPSKVGAGETAIDATDARWLPPATCT